MNMRLQYNPEHIHQWAAFRWFPRGNCWLWEQSFKCRDHALDYVVKQGSN